MSRSVVVVILLILSALPHAAKFTPEFELWLKGKSSYPSASERHGIHAAGVQLKQSQDLDGAKRGEPHTRAPLAATSASVTHDTDAVAIERMQQQQRYQAVAEWEDPPPKARLTATTASVTGDTDAVSSEFQQMQQQRSDQASAELGELSTAPASMSLDTDAVSSEFRQMQQQSDQASAEPGELSPAPASVTLDRDTRGTDFQQMQRQQSDQISAEWREPPLRAQIAAIQASVTGDTDAVGNEFQQMQQQQNDQASAELGKLSPAPASVTLDTATVVADFQQMQRQQSDQASAEWRELPPRARLAFLTTAHSVTHQADADSVGTGFQQVQQRQSDQDSAKRGEPPQLGVAVHRVPPVPIPGEGFGDTQPLRLPRLPPALEDAATAQAAQIPDTISISEERSRLIKYRNKLRHDLEQKKKEAARTNIPVTHSKLP